MHLGVKSRGEKAIFTFIFILFSVFLLTSAFSIYAGTPALGQIAFVSDRDGYTAVYMMNVSEQRRLSSGMNDTDAPQWSPDGARLAFTSTTRSEDGSIAAVEIHTIDASGSGEINLTADMSENDLTAFDPNWSPDGAQLAFVSNAVDRLGDAFNATNLYLIDVATGSLVQVTDESPGSVGCYSPVWLPDSIHLIAICTALMNDWMIVVNTADGSQETLLQEAADPFMLSLSKSGEQLAFMSAFGLTLLQVDEPQDQHIIRPPEADLYPLAFAWSPIEESEMVVQTCHALYRVNTSEDEVDLIATFSDECSLAEYDLFSSPPAWSPDASAIVFVSNHEGNMELYHLDSSSGEIIRLTQNNARDDQPVWRPMVQETSDN